MSNARTRIEDWITSNDVVLFMKGNRTAPQCGFSSRVVELLDDYLPHYATVNVLEDPEIRQGIKDFSSWPTIPQLYVKGKFVGGCDIVTEMGQTGELDEVLGVKRPDLAIPEVFLTANAEKALTDFHEGDGKPTVRVEISSAWHYAMDFDDERNGDIVVEGQNWKLVMNRAAARKADGMKIDFITEGGGGFKIDNPNEPPKVNQLPVEELAAWREGAKPFELIDVRPDEERALASLDGARPLDAATRHMLDGLDRTVPLVFLCHHGNRSQYAAQQALEMGFVNVNNVVGGIDAWSQRIDSDVPRY